MRKLNMDELGRLTPEEYQKTEKVPVALILDNVRSGMNVGSAFRTADAFAIKKIYLCGITAQPPHREILKTALGATESVDWEYRESSKSLVKELRSIGVKVVGVEQAEGSISLDGFVIDQNKEYALVFGNEVNGVSEEVMAVIEDCIEIPQFGTKHSLNISVSIGVVIWDVTQKFRTNK